MGEKRHSKSDDKSRFKDESVKITHKGLSQKKEIKIQIREIGKMIKEAIQSKER